MYTFMWETRTGIKVYAVKLVHPTDRSEMKDISDSNKKFWEELTT
jgi:hypothetical protein